MPNVLTAEALRKLGIPAEEFNASFAEMMRTGIRRVLGYQAATGGWGWYGPEQEDPFMTAVAVRGLSDCVRLGLAVDSVALRRGRERLRTLAGADENLDRRAYAAYALGEPDPVLLAKVDELSPWALALLALTKPDPTLVAKLAGKAEGDHWTAAGWARHDDLSVEATCYAIRALLAADPAHPLIPKATAWLLGQRRDGRWRSTRDTATAVATLLQVTTLERLAEGVAPAADAPALVRRIDVALNARDSRELLVDLANPLKSRFEAHFAAVQPGANVVAFAGPEFPFDAEVRLRSLDRSMRADARGVSIAVETDRPLAGLRRGDEVRVTLTVSAAADCEYAMVLSPIPAGAEVIRGSGEGGFERFEARYDQALFFLRKLGPAQTRLGYRMRCAYSGRYGVLPAWAGLMYNEAVCGSSEPKEALIGP